MRLDRARFLWSFAGLAAISAGITAVTPAHADEPGDPRARDHVIAVSHGTMGTLVTLTAWADDDAAAQAAFQEAFAEFDRLDKLLTQWSPDNAVARIADGAGKKQAVQVDGEILAVVQKSLETSRLTGGAFDITVGAFFGVWKFDQDKDGTLPDPALVAKKRRLLGWKDVVVDARKGTVRLRRAGQRINLGGIAKGYAVDRAVAILRGKGYAHFIVQAGGDLYVSGRRGDRQWAVGIRDPRSTDPADFFALLQLEDMTFSTSGDYERSLVKDGKRYHHILDPATGYPATRSRSVTVMARDAITADGLSTALFILGPEKGMALVEKLPDVEAVFVGADNEVSVSSGLAGKLVIRHPPVDGI